MLEEKTHQEGTDADVKAFKRSRITYADLIESESSEQRLNPQTNKDEIEMKGIIDSVYDSLGGKTMIVEIGREIKPRLFTLSDKQFEDFKKSYGVQSEYELSGREIRVVYRVDRAGPVVE